MGFLTRISSALRLVRQSEGIPHPGPWVFPISGGWLPADVGNSWNWWQQGYDLVPMTPSAMVEACVSAYSQTIAMCPGDHWRKEANGGRVRVTNSALTRILRKPNSYQSISDLLLNITRSLYMNGNAYAFATRNDRSEISELHVMNANLVRAYVADSGDIFYRLMGNRIIDEQFSNLILPARDVLHLRLHTDENDPLMGKTPLVSAALDILASGAMSQQQVAFYLNQARPSTILTTEAVLTKEQAEQLRDRWNEQSRGLAAGGTPILTGGLKPIPMATNAKDSTLAEMMKMSEQHIALAFRIPLQILGIGGTPFASTELLMQSWIAAGLGFTLNHIEEAMGLMFGLKGQPDEYLEFNTQALLRSAHKDRVEAFVRGVQGGVYSPNEARSEFELPAAEDGDEPRVQQQLVPLSFGTEPPVPPVPPPVPVPPQTDDDDTTEPDDEKPGPQRNDHDSSGLAKILLAAADEYDRHAA